MFEGEGCIGVYANKRAGGQYATLKLTMTDEDIVARFKSIVGFGAVNKGTPRKAENKPYWTWQIAGAGKVQAVLAAFWPFLGNRRQAKAEIAIKAIALMPLRASKSRNFCKRGHQYGDARKCKECEVAKYKRYRASKARALMGAARGD